MQITQIAELSKSRSKIYIDQEFAFVLYKGELRLFKLREGEDISEENYLSIMKELLPKRAKLRAMNLLQSKDYTTEQLRKKLRQGLYPEAVIEEALDYVAAFHYTDDLRYAVDYITCHESSRSRRRIEQDLQNKGISKDIAGIAWEKWQEQGGVQDEQGMIQRLLLKRSFEPARADAKERQKVFAFLMRKGFSAEAICRAMGNDDLY